MRRRRPPLRPLAASDLVELFELACRAGGGAGSRLVRLRLGEFGYAPLDAIRARHWLRRGRPPGVRWFY